jgi:hypothetical protein
MSPATFASVTWLFVGWWLAVAVFMLSGWLLFGFPTGITGAAPNVHKLINPGATTISGRGQPTMTGSTVTYATGDRVCCDLVHERRAGAGLADGAVELRRHLRAQDKYADSVSEFINAPTRDCRAIVPCGCATWNRDHRAILGRLSEPVLATTGSRQWIRRQSRRISGKTAVDLPEIWPNQDRAIHCPQPHLPLGS